MTILIIDDSVDQRTILKHHLKKGGFGEVLLAESAEKGFEALGLDKGYVDGNIDLILMDYLMPGINGHEACAKIKESKAHEDIPVIMVTGLADLENLQQAFGAGAMDYIVKPVKKIDLLARVRSALRLKKEIDRRKELTALLEQKVQERTAKLAETNEKLKISMEKAQRLAREAEAANDAKSRFLANMSHEIRTPMNGLIGVADFLRDTVLNSEQGKYVDTIRTSADFLLSIVNDVLDYSKLEAGELGLETSKFDLGELLDRISDIEYAAAKNKGLTWKCVVDDDVPLKLVGDYSRLKQIYMNIVRNAIKFTDKGGVSLKVEKVSDAVDHTILKFSITDTGIGIRRNDLQGLFKYFTMGDDSLNRRFGGTGMGLAISSQLTKLMGGEIGVESEPDIGSTFWFTVKLNKQKNEGSDVKQKKNVDETDNKANRFKILVAEDNPVNRMVALKLLEKLGYEAEAAFDGLKTVEALEKNKYDLVLMDVQMPHMDGLEATKTIRDISSNVLNHAIPVVALTAHAMKGDMEKCLEAGMDDYISKPVNPQKLSETLEKYLKP